MAAVSAFLTSLRYDLRDYPGHDFPDLELIEYLNRAVIQLDSALLSMDSDWLFNTSTAILSSGQNKIAQPTGCISVRSIWISSIIESYTDLTFAASGDTITSAALADFVDDGFVAAQYIGVDATDSNDTEDIGILTLYSVATTVLTVNEDLLVDEGSGDQAATIFALSSDDVVKQSRDSTASRRKRLGADGKPMYWSHEATNILFDYIADQDYGIAIHYNGKSSALTTSSSMPYGDEFNEELRQAVLLMAENRNEKISDATALLYDFFRRAASTKAIRRNYIPKRYRLDF